MGYLLPKPFKEVQKFNFKYCGGVLAKCFNVIDHLLFSSKLLIGQFFFNWRGWNVRTVTVKCNGEIDVGGACWFVWYV